MIIEHYPRSDLQCKSDTRVQQIKKVQNALNSWKTLKFPFFVDGYFKENIYIHDNFKRASKWLCLCGVSGKFNFNQNETKLFISRLGDHTMENKPKIIHFTYIVDTICTCLIFLILIHQKKDLYNNFIQIEEKTSKSSSFSYCN